MKPTYNKGDRVQGKGKKVFGKRGTVKLYQKSDTSSAFIYFVLWDENQDVEKVYANSLKREEPTFNIIPDEWKKSMEAPPVRFVIPYTCHTESDCRTDSETESSSEDMEVDSEGSPTRKRKVSEIPPVTESQPKRVKTD